MRYHINKLGDLEISVTFQERKDIRRDDDFLSNDRMYDIFEPLICNSDLEWIRPEEIAALTDAPILGIVDRDDRGEIIGVIDSVWWYPNYCLRSPQEDLLESGMCVFQKAEAA